MQGLAQPHAAILQSAPAPTATDAAPRRAMLSMTTTARPIAATSRPVPLARVSLPAAGVRSMDPPACAATQTMSNARRIPAPATSSAQMSASGGTAWAYPLIADALAAAAQCARAARPALITNASRLHQAQRPPIRLRKPTPHALAGTAERPPHRAFLRLKPAGRAAIPRQPAKHRAGPQRPQAVTHRHRTRQAQTLK
jgi:hypothetical protein